MKQDEAKLPKWVQARLAALRYEVEHLRTPHAVLTNREWFTIQGQQAGEPYPRKLWWLNHDQPFPCCSLGVGDVLLIGRAKK